jgi:hypothetical protein
MCPDCTRAPLCISRRFLPTAPMGFRFRRSIRLGSGLRLNVSKSGVSTSIGRPGATVNVGPRGASTTVGIPGTGVSYRTDVGGNRTDSTHISDRANASALTSSGLGCFGIVVLLVGVVLLLAGVLTWGSGVLASGLVLWFLQIQRTKAAAERRAAEDRYRRADLAARFGDEICSRILSHEIWLGQTTEQVRESLGEPVDVDIKVMKTKSREVWMMRRSAFMTSRNSTSAETWPLLSTGKSAARLESPPQSLAIAIESTASTKQTRSGWRPR